jgi:hypothetical protein
MKHIQAFIFIALLIVGIGATSSVYATSEEPIPPGKVRIKITRDNNNQHMFDDARININGNEVAKLQRNGSYTGDFNAGKIVIQADARMQFAKYIIWLNADEGVEYSLEIIDNGMLRNGAIVDEMLMSIFGQREKDGIEENKLDAKVVDGSGWFRLIFREVKRLTNISKQPIVEMEKSENLQETKLNELKRLYDKGLISKEIYIERQREILK